MIRRLNKLRSGSRIGKSVLRRGYMNAGKRVGMIHGNNRGTLRLGKAIKAGHIAMPNDLAWAHAQNLTAGLHRGSEIRARAMKVSAGTGIAGGGLYLTSRQRQQRRNAARKKRRRG